MVAAPRFLHRPRVAGLALVSLLALAPPAWAMRVVDYNVLNYPGSSGAVRDPNYRTILVPLDADVIVTEEQSSQAGVDEFLNSVLNTMDPPGTWAAAPFVNGNDTDAALFYKPATVQFLGQWSFYPNPANLLRLVHVYRVKPVGYVSDAAELRLYTAHLKASDGSAEASQRLAEVTGMRDSMNAMPPGTHALALGDFNFYRSSEAGYQKFLETQSNNVGRVFDLLPAGAWHDGASFAPIHTQSTCLSGCLYGEATGGVDDRFDFILPTDNLAPGPGLAVVPGSCVAVGQDGLHLNKAITDAPTIPEGAAYASALLGASDHLPVRLDLQVPARIATDAALAFDPVIVGAPAPTRDLSVSNPAVAPADSLRCSFSAGAGFVAPGPLAVAAGQAAPASVGMETGAPGQLAGDLAIATNDPDHALVHVALSGTVLDHAAVSLDSLVAVADDTLDFGEHLAGTFAPEPAAIFDLGYDELRARLAVSAAQTAGGEGRFTISDFAATLVAEAGARWDVLFDDKDAVLDSTYEATLSFVSADEPLSGAAPQPEVRYLLRARVTSGTIAADPTLPSVTRLYPAAPNPLAGSTALAFDLAAGGHVRLEIFDLAGRRVARIADREFPSGRYRLRWDGRSDAGGPVPSGLYFVRFAAPGRAPAGARLVVVH